MVSRNRSTFFYRSKEMINGGVIRCGVDSAFTPSSCDSQGPWEVDATSCPPAPPAGGGSAGRGAAPRPAPALPPSARGERGVAWRPSRSPPGRPAMAELRCGPHSPRPGGAVRTSELRALGTAPALPAASGRRGSLAVLACWAGGCRVKTSSSGAFSGTQQPLSQMTHHVA